MSQSLKLCICMHVDPICTATLIHLDLDQHSRIAPYRYSIADKLLYFARRVPCCTNAYAESSGSCCLPPFICLFANGQTKLCLQTSHSAPSAWVRKQTLQLYIQRHIWRQKTANSCSQSYEGEGHADTDTELAVPYTNVLRKQDQTYCNCHHSPWAR